jgi:hypothetical protein
MIKVFKNVLKKEEADYLEDRFTSNTFPWFITRGIVNEKIDKDYQFNHIFYTDFRINFVRTYFKCIKTNFFNKN